MDQSCSIRSGGGTDGHVKANTLSLQLFEQPNKREIQRAKSAHIKERKRYKVGYNMGIKCTTELRSENQINL